jgi:hypothetical protein
LKNLTDIDRQIGGEIIIPTAYHICLKATLIFKDKYLIAMNDYTPLGSDSRYDRFTSDESFGG